MDKAFALAILAPLAAAALAGQAVAADVARGKELYVKTGCWGCHGYAGQGGVAGPKIAPEPMPLEALITFLRKADATRMPPYNAVELPDKDVADIHAYMASLPKPADWRTIPLLRP
jgi:mono/diheme cytochrome c family protein